MGSSVMIRTPYTDWIFDRRGSYRQSTQVKHQDVVGEQLLGFCRRQDNFGKNSSVVDSIF